MNIVNNKELIFEILENVSYTIKDIVKNSHGKMLLIEKLITHSDIPTYAKRTEKEQELSRNILYYISSNEMKIIEEQTDRNYECAKQSNIYMPIGFYDFLSLPNPRACVKNLIFPRINDKCDVYLVKDTLSYFTKKHVSLVHSKLGRSTRNKYDNMLDAWEDYNVKNSLEKIKLNYAVHGIGTAEDKVFHSLRSTIFRSDKIYILLIKEPSQRHKIYILLRRNPLFFTIIGEKNESWRKYILKEEEKQQYNINVQDKKDLLNEKSRVFQNTWRNLLAEEMMNYNIHDDYVFCPISFIESNFTDLGTLYRASHIKEFKECNNDEAYDLNNGLLLAANIDALFDKHYISVNPKKELVISYLIKPNKILISRLGLNNGIFKLALNEDRMKYLLYHYNKFLECEEKRKKGK
ncbi:HNH endonuclease [Candidatus Izemoplasma sp. B36]|uniref:HNH endonuclease n=1 Tax=Candidatus Izemoplasma sp. B36 TaxID=3242468 RepID=UPI0035569180